MKLSINFLNLIILDSIYFLIVNCKFYIIQKTIKIIFIFLIFLNIFLTKKESINNYNDQKGKIKVSVFLAIYNKEKYLKRSIESIQKQTLKELEIIAVNDYSSDNSLKILKEMNKKDTRIKIINNEKNYGSCYSRAIGILNSKGEYLLSLDPDDKYQGKNSLKYLYNKAKILNVDIINFLILYLPERKKSEKLSEYNKIIKQPKLFQSAFRKEDNILKDFYITNKLIKRELLENAYKIFKRYLHNKKWNYFEDNIWSILTYKYANSSIFINKKIYYYYLNKESVMMNRGNILEMKNLLYRNEMYIEIFKNKEEEKYIIAGYVELLDIFENNINLIKENNDIKYSFIKNIKEFNKNYNISMEMRKKINNLINLIF